MSSTFVPEDTPEQLSQRLEQIETGWEQKRSVLESRIDTLQEKRTIASKKKIGRPPKHKKDLASERIFFRLNPGETERLQEFAEPGESVGQTARRLLIQFMQETEAKRTPSTR